MVHEDCDVATQKTVRDRINLFKKAVAAEGKHLRRLGLRPTGLIAEYEWLLQAWREEYTSQTQLLDDEDRPPAVLKVLRSKWEEMGERYRNLQNVLEVARQRWWDQVSGLLTKDTQRDVSSKTPAGRKKTEVRLDDGGGIIYINECPYALHSKSATVFFRVLFKNRGMPIKSTEFVRMGVRADRVWRSLPRPLQRLVFRPGKGRIGYILP